MLECRACKSSCRQALWASSAACPLYRGVPPCACLPLILPAPRSVSYARKAAASPAVAPRPSCRCRSTSAALSYHGSPPLPYRPCSAAGLRMLPSARLPRKVWRSCERSWRHSTAIGLGACQPRRGHVKQGCRAYQSHHGPMFQLFTDPPCLLHPAISSHICLGNQLVMP